MTYQGGRPECHAPSRKVLATFWHRPDPQIKTFFIPVCRLHQFRLRFRRRGFFGHTFTKPGFAAEGAGLKRFDYAVANPMWNQDNYGESLYENDQWKRFERGAAPSSSADWGWLQHIAASLNDSGRAAVVLDTGAVSRGSGSKSSNKEKTIRQAFVDADLIEAVVLLPENLFYNTSAPGIVVVLNRHKNNGRKGQFLLINASVFFVKKKPKNELTNAGRRPPSFRDQLNSQGWRVGTNAADIAIFEIW